MRYIPINCLREGMKLGKNVYGSSNQLLLASGIILKEKYIEKIWNLGYSGMYIEDDISKDIEVANVISEDLRQRTVAAVKNVFMHTKDDNKDAFEKSLEQSRQLVGDIVNEIIENKTLMVNMIDLKLLNDYTFYHSVNVAVLCIVMGVALQYSYRQLYNLGMGALLHDEGKMLIPQDILNKPGKLTDDEFEIIKTHPKAGYEFLLKTAVLPSLSYTLVLQHHERFDGSGYPYGLQGQAIHKDSRLLAVADVYDALISDRPYRKALPPSEAMEFIMGGSSTLFDPEIVRVFIQKIAPYPVGTVVQLSNGERAVVLQNFESFGTRPKVRLLQDGKASGREISLKDNPDYLSVTIQGIVDL